MMQILLPSNLFNNGLEICYKTSLVSRPFRDAQKMWGGGRRGPGGGEWGI